jgi:hypothetical protein
MQMSIADLSLSILAGDEASAGLLISKVSLHAECYMNWSIRYRAGDRKREGVVTGGRRFLAVARQWTLAGGPAKLIGFDWLCLQHNLMCARLQDLIPKID